MVATLLTRGPLPRADVAKALDVSRSRLSPEVGHLLAKGMARETPAPISTGGRRGSWVVLGDSRFGVIAGADIDVSGVALVLMQLDGTVLMRRTVDGIYPTDPAATMRAIGDALKSEIKKGGKVLRAIGVSIAADVDGLGQVCEPPPTMPQWTGVSIGEYFTKRFAVPTYVENDVNVLAIAEGARGGPASAHATYAVVKVSSGVGCGLVINGSLARGADGYAGDIGHVCIDPSDETPCACGNKGCLEAVVSAPALIRGAESAAHGGESPVLTAMMQDQPALTLENLGEAAQLEDPTTTAILRSAGRHVGYALAGLVSMLNPSAVFVSTGIRGAEDLVLSAIRQCVYERARPAATRGLVIGTCQLGRDDGAVGAAEFACRGLVTIDSATGAP
ncbi:ROK family protein [Mycobacterium hodleri]|uniref:ROK family protein n=1 Tax=Mycolicibacterium hodleri TaxID=49897 RepID=A0A502DZH1_9MYCO|nr:ROK family protein [Mycolicibacterium hodleri]